VSLEIRNIVASSGLAVNQGSSTSATSTRRRANGARCAGLSTSASLLDHTARAHSTSMLPGFSSGQCLGINQCYRVLLGQRAKCRLRISTLGQQPAQFPGRPDAGLPAMKAGRSPLPKGHSWPSPNRCPIRQKREIPSVLPDSSRSGSPAGKNWLLRCPIGTVFTALAKEFEARNQHQRSQASANGLRNCRGCPRPGNCAPGNAQPFAASGRILFMPVAATESSAVPDCSHSRFSSITTLLGN